MTLNHKLSRVSFPTFITLERSVVAIVYLAFALVEVPTCSVMERCSGIGGLESGRSGRSWKVSKWDKEDSQFRKHSESALPGIITCNIIFSINNKLITLPIFTTIPTHNKAFYTKH